jgi:dienelactone hydrolase
LLAERLVAATAWLRRIPEGRGYRIGYAGTGTGAAAGLWAAADDRSKVAAVVSCAGRPDLAAERLYRTRAPALLLVGAEDPTVLALNREVRDRLRGTAELALVPGASGRLTEPGALDGAARLVRNWFARHLAVDTAAASARR